ncbi:CFI-box-CTERM domain-containing protein [uncultured Tateyamaria sp.]|uniref:CFI-box-CTERM domain-containing protein n=1 Tax=uncultured Tateyamaria sp. TaxID=455651 RepID=UPI0026325FF6|nr:CFI-box-CTERM domain-containing protein [uncultured Tateyamaria sp.]
MNTAHSKVLGTVSAAALMLCNPVPAVAQSAFLDGIAQDAHREVRSEHLMLEIDSVYRCTPSCNGSSRAKRESRDTARSDRRGNANGRGVAGRALDRAKDAYDAARDKVTGGGRRGGSSGGGSFDGGEGDGGGCFLTTAIVERRGEADNGPTLTVLRSFRDEVMANDPKLHPFIAEYYAMAPAIVAAIPADDPEWDWIESQIDLCVQLIEIGDTEQTFATYKAMVERLQSRWLPVAPPKILEDA